MIKRQFVQPGLLITLMIASTISPVFAQQRPWGEIGRQATLAEVKAWDIDVRGDFKGLPQGSGTVAKGEVVWESKCASCHGTFGESNEVFTPIVGGTTDADIKTGHVAALANNSTPGRTTLMKVSKLSTLWDYINRAMPWTAPKSLSTEEVYAVVGYILNLGGIVPSDFTLSDKNIAEIQARLPNRNGTAIFDDLWKVNGKGDVKNIACMQNCATEIKITSFLPDSARNAHGNLAEQNRLIGAVRGANTTAPAAKGTFVAGTPPAITQAKSPAEKSESNAEKNAPLPAPKVTDVSGLLTSNGCLACHGMKNKILGPGFNEIAAKHKNRTDLENYLVGKIKSGGSGIWGAIPMPPQAALKDKDAKTIAQWIAAGAPQQ